MKLNWLLFIQIRDNCGSWIHVFSLFKLLWTGTCVAISSERHPRQKSGNSSQHKAYIYDYSQPRKKSWPHSLIDWGNQTRNVGQRFADFFSSFLIDIVRNTHSRQEHPPRRSYHWFSSSFGFGTPALWSESSAIWTGHVNFQFESDTPESIDCLPLLRTPDSIVSAMSAWSRLTWISNTKDVSAQHVITYFRNNKRINSWRFFCQPNLFATRAVSA